MSHEATSIGIPVQVLLLHATILLLGIPVRLITRHFPGIPQTVINIILGVTIGLIWPLLGEDFKRLSDMNTAETAKPALLIYIPIFMVSSMYRIEYPNFIKYLPQVILITLVGSVLGPLLVGFFLINATSAKIPFSNGALRAIALMPIEPWHAIVILRRFARFKDLETILEAEAVVMLIPLFLLFDVLMGINVDYITEWYHIVNIVLRNVILGFAIGYPLGQLHSLFLVYWDNEGFATVGVSLCATYIIYIFTQFVAFGSGTLALLLNICVVMSKRHKILPQVDANIVTVFTQYQILLERLSLTFIITLFTIFLRNNFRMSMAYGVIFVYLTTLSIRLIGYVCLSPVIQRMTSQVNLKGIMVLTWSGIRGPISLNVMLLLLSCNIISQDESFLFEVFLNTVLSLLINAATMEPLFRMLKFSQLSVAQRENINYYAHLLNMKSEDVICKLKRNRHFGGAYWQYVKKYVIIAFKSEKQIEDKIQQMTDSETCKNCPVDVPYDISEEELGELLKLHEIKVLKVQKIFLIAQYHRGSIEKRCLELLRKEIERRLDYSKHRTASIRVRSYFKPNKSLKYSQDIIRWICAVPKFTPPPHYFPMRQLFFYIILHVAYDYITFAFTLVNSIFILWNNRRCCPWMYNYHVGLWFIYFCIFAFKMIGLSHSKFIVSALKPYFKRKGYGLEFFCLIMGFLNLLSFQDECLYGWVCVYVLPSMRSIAALRLIFVVNFIPKLCPFLLKHIEYKINMRSCFGYQIGTALIECQQDVIKFLPEFVEMKMISDTLRREMENNIKELYEVLEVIEEEQPFIPLTVKTKQTITITLNALKERLQELQMFSVFESKECDYISTLILRQYKLIKKIKIVPVYLTQELLKCIPWIGTEGHYTVDLQKVSLVSWKTGDLVQSRGLVSNGIYVLINGMLRMYCVPHEKDHSRGALPIVDKLSSVDAHRMEDTLLPGDLIGELSYITGRPYDCTIVAESFSQAYWFPPEVLKEAFEANSHYITGLECNIWRNCCLNMAVALLMTIPVYQAQSEADMRHKLKDCFMPMLDAFQTFVFTDKMGDILLIQGVVESALTGEIFIAPVLLPHGVQKILLYPSLDRFGITGSDAKNTTIMQPRLLIVPKEDTNAIEIMTEEEELVEFSADVYHNLLLTSQSFNLNTVKNFINAPLLNVDSESMLSYKWESDKEILNFDSEDDLPKELLYDKSMEMVLMTKSKRVQLDSVSDLASTWNTRKSLRNHHNSLK